LKKEKMSSPNNNNNNTSNPTNKSENSSTGSGGKKTTASFHKYQGKQRHQGNGGTNNKFEGTTEGVLGHIYDCRYDQADLYAKTTKAIAEYVGKQLKGGYEVGKAMEKLVDIMPTLPDELPADASAVEKLVFDKEITEYVKEKALYKAAKKQAYAIVWSQCSEIMKSKVEALPDYSAIEKSGDVILLLKGVKNIAHNFQNEKYKAHALHEAKRRFYTTYQSTGMSVQVYYERFKNHVEVIEHCGGTMLEPGLILEELQTIITETGSTTTSNGQVSDARKLARDRYLAVSFLLSSDRNRFGKLVEDLENNFIQGMDKYPRTLENAYSLLLYWKHDPRNNMRASGADSEGVAFAQVSQDKKGKSLEHVKCYSCNKMGHYANECPEIKKRNNQSDKRKEESVHIQVDDNNNNEVTVLEEYTNIQIEEDLLTSFDFCIMGDPVIQEVHETTTGIVHSQGSTIPKSWIILDNRSTVDIFSNRNLLKNVR
jgi:Zinc knuckle